MKREYIKPVLTVVPLCTQTTILTGSTFPEEMNLYDFDEDEEVERL